MCKCGIFYFLCGCIVWNAVCAHLWSYSTNSDIILEMNRDQEIERDATSNTFLPLPPSSSITVTEKNQKFFDHMKQGSSAIKIVITKDFIILYFRLIKILFQDFLPLLWLYPHQLWSHHHGDHSLRVTESVLRVSRRVMAGQQGDSVLPVVTRVT